MAMDIIISLECGGLGGERDRLLPVLSLSINSHLIILSIDGSIIDKLSAEKVCSKVIYRWLYTNYTYYIIPFSIDLKHLKFAFDYVLLLGPYILFSTAFLP